MGAQSVRAECEQFAADFIQLLGRYLLKIASFIAVNEYGCAEIDVEKLYGLKKRMDYFQI